MVAKRNASATPDFVAMGPEPTWGNQHEVDEVTFNSMFVAALNWYNYFNDRKEGTKLLIQYMKKNGYSKEDIEAAKNCEDWRVGSTFISLCKMQENGLERTTEKTDFKRYCEKQVAELVAYGSSVKEVQSDDEEPTQSVVKPNIQQRMLAVAGEYVCELDSALDDFVANKYKGEFDSYEFCRAKSINAPVAKKMLDMIRGEVEEYEEALLGEDEQLVEGYSHLTKKQLAALAQFMRNIYEGIERHSSNSKKVRKPRKSRPKPAHKLVQKVKFQKEAPEYKIVSIDPTKIIGAEQLWVFNTKTRMLFVYNATARTGLSMKGTTIQGYDEETSIGKKLRKPEEVIKRVLDGGKIVLRKLMSEIKSVDKPANGRINEQTILLRVG